MLNFWTPFFADSTICPDFTSSCDEGSEKWHRNSGNEISSCKTEVVTPINHTTIEPLLLGFKSFDVYFSFFVPDKRCCHFVWVIFLAWETGKENQTPNIISPSVFIFYLNVWLVMVRLFFVTYLCCKCVILLDSQFCVCLVDPHWVGYRNISSWQTGANQRVRDSKVTPLTNWSKSKGELIYFNIFIQI